MGTMTACSRCRSVLWEDDRYCDSCGYVFGSVPPTETLIKDRLAGIDITFPDGYFVELRVAHKGRAVQLMNAPHAGYRGLPEALSRYSLISSELLVARQQLAQLKAIAAVSSSVPDYVARILASVEDSPAKTLKDVATKPASPVVEVVQPERESLTDSGIRYRVMVTRPDGTEFDWWPKHTYTGQGTVGVLAYISRESKKSSSKWVGCVGRAVPA